MPPSVGPTLAAGSEAAGVDAENGAGTGADGDGRAALRVRRLELDLADLRAENARLKGSIAQRQDEVLRLGERGAALLAEIAALKRGLADTQAALAARAGPLWPVRAALRRLGMSRPRKA